MARRWVAHEWGVPENWRLEEYEPGAPGDGEITVRVRAAGVNPADAKHVAQHRPGVSLPVPIGYEISGEVTAVGAAVDHVRLGDEVLAFRILGGYATEMTIPAGKAFIKPATLSHAEAANLLLAGTTAAEMLAVTRGAAGETILLHGASGAVGVSVLQQARLAGIRVIGTASEGRFDVVRRFGGIPVRYGPGLVERVRDIAAAPVAAALDAVGTTEAIESSLDLVPDRSRIVTIVAPARAQEAGIVWIAGSQPASARFRDAVRGRLVDLAAQGDLVVPMAGEYPLTEAPETARVLAEGHPGGKLALIP